MKFSKLVMLCSFALAFATANTTGSFQLVSDANAQVPVLVPKLPTEPLLGAKCDSITCVTDPNDKDFCIVDGIYKGSPICSNRVKKDPNTKSVEKEAIRIACRNQTKDQVVNGTLGDGTTIEITCDGNGGGKITKRTKPPAKK